METVTIELSTYNHMQKRIAYLEEEVKKKEIIVYDDFYTRMAYLILLILVGITMTFFH